MDKATALVAATRHLNRPAIVSSGHGHRQACCKPFLGQGPGVIARAVSPQGASDRSGQARKGRGQRGSRLSTLSSSALPPTLSVTASAVEGLIARWRAASRRGLQSPFRNLIARRRARGSDNRRDREGRRMNGKDQPGFGLFGDCGADHASSAFGTISPERL